MQRSTGRGGAGNIQPSASIGREDNYSPNRGREIKADATNDKARIHRILSLHVQLTSLSSTQAKSSGRGGVGNIRSRSRARSASVVPEGCPQTASMVSEEAAVISAHERSVIEDARKNIMLVSIEFGAVRALRQSLPPSRPLRLLPRLSLSN